MPYQEAPNPPVDDALRARCADAMYVIKADGEVIHSGQAVLLMGEAVGYGRLAAIGRLRPMIWGVEVGYRLMADNRRFVSRFLFRTE